jgi:predicted RNase H-like HicB family nuclease
MAHYIAIIEEAGPDHAVGVWFPDPPGRTSAGDDIDEALRNAPEALELYAESFEADGKPLPRPRTLTELRTEPEIAGEINRYIVALIELPARARLNSSGVLPRTYQVFRDTRTGDRDAAVHCIDPQRYRRLLRRVVFPIFLVSSRVGTPLTKPCGRPRRF